MSMSQLNTRQTKLDTKIVENVRDRKNLLWIDNVNICSNNKLQMCVILSKMTCLQYWLKSFFCNKRMKWMLETLTVRIVFAQCYHHHVHLKWCTQHSCFWHFSIFWRFFHQLQRINLSEFSGTSPFLCDLKYDSLTIYIIEPYSVFRLCILGLW